MAFVNLSLRAPVALPEGRAGQALALAATLGLMAIVWFGVIAPLGDWYGARARRLALARVEFAHERALVAALPRLRGAVRALDRARAGEAVLPGNADPVAAAALQGEVQALAGTAGISFDSAETLPGVAVDGLRRIKLRVTMTCSYEKLAALLGAIAEARPRMLAGALSIDGTGLPDPLHDPPVHASFTVSGFRAAAPPR